MSVSKAKVWDAVIDPWGKAVMLSTATQALDLRLPGQWHQAESGLSQNWMRDYDPVLGRYVQADPLGIEAGQNLYGYVDGNPLNAIDRDGLDALWISFPSYEVGLPYGLSFPFGHQGVAAIDPKTGEAWYYDFGRYENAECGMVRGPYWIGKVDFMNDGRPTWKSIRKALNTASLRFGKGNPAQWEYTKKPFKDVVDYTKKRKREAENCKRPYNFLFDNCKNFAREAAGL